MTCEVSQENRPPVSIKNYSPAAVSFSIVATYFASIAVLTGGFSAVAPERRSEVARYGLRVVLAATLSNLMSATIAGMFVTLN